MRYRSLIVASLLAAAGCGTTTDANSDVTLTATAGNLQTGTVSQALAVPLTIKATDALGAALQGITIDWSVASGGGSVSPASSVTGLNGLATTTLTLGSAAGPNTVKATLRGSSRSVVFTETAQMALIINALAGNNQSGTAGQPLPTQLRVQVLENGQAASPPRNILWTVGSGGGTLAAATSTTDAAGVAGTTFTLGPAIGAQSVVATVEGTTASVTFNLTAFAAGTNPVLVATVPVAANYGHHDTFVRDGIAFVLAWNSGVLIYDVGNGMRGGSPTNPVLISSLVTNANGVPGGAQVHNAWWFQNPNTGEKKYLFIGQEGPGSVGSASSGDIHIVDVSNLAAPVEVGFVHVANAGTHNFWMDEQRQVLYAAYYNGGVIAVDVSGPLVGDMSSRIIAQAKPGGAGNTYIWGVMLANGTLYATDMLSGFWALDPVTLTTRGGGNNVPDRYGSDQWVVGAWAYSGTWGARSGVRGNAVKVWSLGSPGGNPVLVDSIIVPNIGTVSDVAVTPDGKALVITAENGSGGAGLYVYDRVDPRRPVLRGATFVAQGIHTGEIAVINGRTYVFAARDPANPALLIFDITGVVPRGHDTS
ncbi:MAG: Ig-like domain-containing protein [Gemmatimonadota bacterium]